MRCQQPINRFGKLCGTLVVQLPHYATGELITLELEPTPRGDYIMTSDGFCGELPPEQKDLLIAANVLILRRHKCQPKQNGE